MKSYVDAPPFCLNNGPDGWAVTFRAPRGGYTGTILGAPHINWRHIDGPLLYFSDGQMHWLTPWERIGCYFGWTDARRIQRKRRPILTAALTQALAEV